MGRGIVRVSLNAFWWLAGVGRVGRRWRAGRGLATWYADVGSLSEGYPADAKGASTAAISSSVRPWTR